MKTILTIFFFICQLSLIAKNDLKIYCTSFTSCLPQIDGVLNDACWQYSDWGTNFIEFEPTAGALPSQQTAFNGTYF